MSSHPKPLVAALATILSLGSLVRGDEASYAAVVRERDAVLSQILANREDGRSSGMADEAAIASAQLALYSFRRDVATTTREKIKNQELIVRVFEKKLEHVEAMAKAGTAGKIAILEAKAPLLEARQRLEELRLGAKG